ncbi:hypothetical protein IAG41_08430 [Sphingomonas sp. JC676]|uniref:hypothetical protein n=1 Tax=Sphingomonas sp. JC676 TaxID=2768065 RepID=UPI0016585F5A|nr:hypothetical protein [Sphingomonas sp. JC676]MBC9032414.1 hypothetical protein [Sphingomonas sp. JC676]
MAQLASIAPAMAPEAARDMLDRSAIGALEMARPPLDDLAYRDFIRALLRAPGFKLDLNRLEPDAALAMVSDRILGPGVFACERAELAADIAALAEFAGALAETRASVAIRTYFAPGDLVWHVDRVHERAAFRLLWPLGRPAGMRVTPADNINARLHRAYMRREHPLLCRLDAQVLRSGAPVETLWAHRPIQLAAMMSGHFPFLVDPEREIEVTPGAVSIHRIETPAQVGAYHRSSWANRRSPGLQVVITAVSDPP